MGPPLQLKHTKTRILICLVFSNQLFLNRVQIWLSKFRRAYDLRRKPILFHSYKTERSCSQKKEMKTRWSDFWNGIFKEIITRPIYSYLYMMILFIQLHFNFRIKKTVTLYLDEVFLGNNVIFEVKYFNSPQITLPPKNTLSKHSLRVLMQGL